MSDFFFWTSAALRVCFWPRILRAKARQSQVVRREHVGSSQCGLLIQIQSGWVQRENSNSNRKPWEKGSKNRRSSEVTGRRQT